MQETTPPNETVVCYNTKSLAVAWNNVVRLLQTLKWVDELFHEGTIPGTALSTNHGRKPSLQDLPAHHSSSSRFNVLPFDR